VPGKKVKGPNEFRRRAWDQKGKKKTRPSVLEAWAAMSEEREEECRFRSKDRIMEWAEGGRRGLFSLTPAEKNERSKDKQTKRR